jgi:hypothetical protein
METKPMLIIAGSSAGAVVALVSAWNLVMIPYLNSDLSPVVGARRFEAAQTIQKDIADALKDTAESLKLTAQGLAKTNSRLDSTECSDNNRRLRTAQEALRRNQNDPIARDAFDAAAEKIRNLPDCMREP